MYFPRVAALSFLLLLDVALSAAIPDTPQQARSPGSDVNIVTARQLQARTLASTTHTTTTSSTRRTATSSPIVAPEHRNHNVAVGFNGTSFTPSALKNITIGDSVTFYFYPHNFSLVQSTFTRPCTPSTDTVNQDPIFSGFHFDTESGISLNKFILNITMIDPIWIYGYDGNAADGGSLCQRGMVMVINPLSKERANGQTLKAYVKSANAVALDVAGAVVERAPQRIYGGTKVRLTERQKAHWEARHPQNVLLDTDDVVDTGSGNVFNSTTTFGSSVNHNGTNSTQIPSFHSGAERAVGNKTALTGLAVIFVAAVFGLGM